MRKQRIVLEHHIDGAATGRNTRDVFTLNEYLTFRRLFKTRHHPHGRSLSTARWFEDGGPPGGALGRVKAARLIVRSWPLSRDLKPLPIPSGSNNQIFRAGTQTDVMMAGRKLGSQKKSGPTNKGHGTDRRASPSLERQRHGGQETPRRQAVQIGEVFSDQNVRAQEVMMGQKGFRCKMIYRKSVRASQAHTAQNQQVGGIYGQSRPSIKEFCGAGGVFPKL